VADVADLPGGAVVDAKPYIRHHPVIGYEYVPNFLATLPQPGGGRYTLRTNAAGLRSSRDYTLEKPPGTTRLLVFGDSFAAGQYVSNEQRFTELLERRNPGLEVINFGLEGTGTDQQLLLYEEVGRRYEHDAVLLMPFLQNIRRNLADAREAVDPHTHRRVLLPKPRFELDGEALRLLNVPVPAERRELNGRPTDVRTDQPTLTGRLKARLNRFGAVRLLKRLVYAAVPWEPFPEYRREDAPAWRLMRAILLRFKQAAGERPLFIVPAVYASYVQYRMATSYLDRFRSLTGVAGVTVIDLLPSYRSMDGDPVRCFFEPHDCHYSPLGHLHLADVLQDPLARAGLLPGRGP
jgi:hypothetical protein